jgi:succinate dehydrogenase / fumarate reductase flavoprotein subunit
MYQNINERRSPGHADENYPAVHYTMGGLWVDYELMTSVPGLYCLGEANFSDHGANRLGPRRSCRDLPTAIYVLPYTIANYLSANIFTKPLPLDHPLSRKRKKLPVTG